MRPPRRPASPSGAWPGRGSVAVAVVHADDTDYRGRPPLLALVGRQADDRAGGVRHPDCWEPPAEIYVLGHDQVSRSRTGELRVTTMARREIRPGPTAGGGRLESVEKGGTRSCSGIHEKPRPSRER